MKSLFLLIVISLCFVGCDMTPIDSRDRILLNRYWDSSDKYHALYNKPFTSKAQKDSAFALEDYYTHLADEVMDKIKNKEK